MSREDETPRLPIFPDDPPNPPTTLQEAGAQLIYSITLAVYKLHTVIDIEIRRAQED